MSKIDLDYAYRQAELSKEAVRHCVISIIGGRFGLPLSIQERLLRTIGHPNRIPRAHRQSKGKLNTSLAR